MVLYDPGFYSVSAILEEIEKGQKPGSTGSYNKKFMHGTAVTGIGAYLRYECSALMQIYILSGGKNG